MKHREHINNWLIVLIIALVILLVFFIPSKFSTKDALYLYPTSCGDACDVGKIKSFMNDEFSKDIQGKQAKFLNAAVILIEVEGEVNMIPAQSISAAREGLCEILDGKSC